MAIRLIATAAVLVAGVAYFAHARPSLEYQQQQRQRYELAERDCRDDALRNRAITTQTKFQQCLNAASENYYRDIEYPYIDVILWQNSAELFVAVEADKGTISGQELVARDREIEMKANDEIRRRVDDDIARDNEVFNQKMRELDAIYPDEPPAASQTDAGWPFWCQQYDRDSMYCY